MLGNQRCPAPPWWVHKSAVMATLNQSHFIIYSIFAEHQTEAISTHMLIPQFIPASLIAIVSVEKKQWNYSNCVTLSCSVFAAKVISLPDPWTKEMIEWFFLSTWGKMKTRITIIILQEGFLGLHWDRLATIIVRILTKCSQLYSSWDFNHFWVYGSFWLLL